MVSTSVNLRPSSCVLTSCPRIDLAMGRFPAGKTLSYPLDVILPICPKWYQHSVFHKPLITPRVGNNYKADQAKHIHTPTKTSTSYTYYLSYWALSSLASAYSLVVPTPPLHFHCWVLTMHGLRYTHHIIQFSSLISRIIVNAPSLLSEVSWCG